MRKGMGIGMASEILITSLARSGEGTISTCRSMPSHMVRAEDRHLKSWGKKKTLKIFTFISQAPFLKKLVKNGWRGKGGTQKEKEERGKRGKEGDTNKQGYVTAPHNLAQKLQSPHAQDSIFMK